MVADLHVGGLDRHALLVGAVEERVPVVPALVLVPRTLGDHEPVEGVRRLVLQPGPQVGADAHDLVDARLGAQQRGGVLGLSRGLDVPVAAAPVEAADGAARQGMRVGRELVLALDVPQRGDVEVAVRALGAAADDAAAGAGLVEVEGVGLTMVHGCLQWSCGWLVLRPYRIPVTNTSV